MTTLLVLAPHPGFADTIRAALNPHQYRIVHRATIEDAQPLLGHDLVAACIVDVELETIQGVWFVEKLRHHVPDRPVIIYRGNSGWEWEEEAYLAGAAMVLAKPVRGRMLQILLERIFLQVSQPSSTLSHSDKPMFTPTEGKQFIVNFAFALLLFGLAIALSFVSDLCLRTDRPQWLVLGIETVSIWLFVMDGIVLCGLCTVSALRAVFHIGQERTRISPPKGEASK